MKYKLTYRMARRNPDPFKGTPAEAIPSGRVACFVEEVEKSRILTRMKELQNEHNEEVKYNSTLPQFIQFFPLETIQ